VKVVVVAEYYPRAADPVLGIWAHKQALAARAAGAEVRVIVLHRPVPSRAAARTKNPAEILRPLRQPLRTRPDGLHVTFVPFLAPPRPGSYGAWGAWAAPPLALALKALRHRFPYDLVHAHYAAPAGDAVRRARTGTPYVVSVHGGDVLAVAQEERGRRAVEAALAGARLVMANSSAIEERCHDLGAARTRVVHLGTDVPPQPRPRGTEIVTVANLVARKRHEDVLHALVELPQARWVVIGDGPERPALERLARQLGVASRVDFRGALPHPEAVLAAQSAGVFVLPSVDEAFGVAYVEAMAGGVPAVGCAGEPGPEEIARCGGGIRLVPPRDPKALATAIEEAGRDEALGEQARRTVIEHFTWAGCGRATVEAYEAALA
jgi:glycosyltransferase involved in cell wall biosynthesis